MADIELLSMVALLEGTPEKGLLRGQVGTVVEILAPGISKWSLATTPAEHTPLSPYSPTR